LFVQTAKQTNKRKPTKANLFSSNRLNELAGRQRPSIPPRIFTY